MTRRWVYFFGQGQADGGSDLKPLVGGKGASLADMTRAGLNVPPGFTLSTECCRHYYEQGRTWPDGLDAEIRANLARLEQLAGRTFGVGDRPLLVAVRSGAAQSMPGMMDTVLNVGLNPDCVRAMGARTANLRGAWEAYLHYLLMFAHTVGGLDNAHLQAEIGQFVDRVGKRREEDLDAGQLETLCERLRALYRQKAGHALPTEPWSMLCAAIDAVFGSWMTDRAVSYRQHHGIDGLLGTAVNVQMMCPSEVSGVMFTANPVNPSLKQILIEAAFGLGEAVVLGKVTPDRFVLDKTSLAIKERYIARKETRVATLAEDGAGQTGACDAASLTDAQVHELAQLGERVETYFKTPCDIEWALSQGQLFLLQSRPIKFQAVSSATATSDPATRERVRQEEIAALKQMASPTGTVWARFNLSEILPEPTPMTWAIVRRFMSGQGGYGQMYRDLGFDPDPALDAVGVYDLIAGRPYCNLDREPRMQYRLLPFAHDFDRLKAEPGQAIYPQATFRRERITWRFLLLAPVVFFKMFQAELRQRRIARTFADEFEQKIVPAFLAEVEPAEQEDWSRLSSAQLLERLAFWQRRTLVDFARHSLKPTALTALRMGSLERTIAARLQPPGTTLPAGTPTGAERAEAAIRALMMGVRPTEDADLSGGLHSLQAGKLSLDAFLQRFGHRASNEMELARPRWAEEPAAVMQMAETSGDQPPASDAQAAWQKTWQQLALDLKLLPAQRPAVEAEFQALQRDLGLRETAKHYLLRGYALIRRVLVELDQRYRLDGGIFFLTPDELPALVAAPLGQPPQALLDTIAQRRQRHALALSLPVPQVLFSDDLEAIGREADYGSADVMQGTPLSAGVAEAPALVLSEAHGAAIPAEPYILVCPSTDPAWVPLFGKARGLVMETGGVLSHGAIAAREYNLPAVAGITDVHRRLKTGQRLRVDGGTGKVSILA